MVMGGRRTRGNGTSTDLSNQRASRVGLWGVVPGGKRPSEWAEQNPDPSSHRRNCGTSIGMVGLGAKTTLFRRGLVCVLQANCESCRVTSRRPTMGVKKRGSTSKPEAVGVGKVRVAWGNRRELCGDGSNEESQADTLLDVVARMRDQESYAGWPNGLAA